MGIMTELYLAPVDAVGPAAMPPGAENRAWGDLTSLEFGTLWAAVEGVPWDVHRHDLHPVETGSATDELVFRFPPALTVALAELTEDRAEQVLSVWAATDEIDTEPAAVRHVLDGTRELARLAVATGRAVHLWFSF